MVGPGQEFCLQKERKEKPEEFFTNANRLHCPAVSLQYIQNSNHTAMDDTTSKQEEKGAPLQENPRHDFGDHYIQKMEDGYYKAFAWDGTERRDIFPGINHALRTLNLSTPIGVTIYYNPPDRYIEIEPRLAVLRQRYEAKMKGNPFA